MVASFLNVVLSKIAERCYEDALYVAYANNIRKFPDLDFSSLPAQSEKCKRKLSPRIKKDKKALEAEFPTEEEINAREQLTFDDAPIDEQLKLDEEEDDGDDNDDNDDHDDGDGEGNGGDGVGFFKGLSDKD